MKTLKDYCSFSPDFSFGSCCETHDEDYSRGSGVPRDIADRELRLCIISCTSEWIAWLYWAFVRTFGWLFYKGGA